MKDFILKNVSGNIESELEKIGFDKTYFRKAADKYRYKNFKIYALTIPQANILKQTAISVGADCAVHRETITGKVDKTDCILGGSFSQLQKIAQKLRTQPFKLAKLADLIEEDLAEKLTPLLLKNRMFDFKKPYIVGVLNLTKNSFSDGGDFFEFKNAKTQFLKLVEDGADIIELGAESTKPFSTAISAEEQLDRLLPMLDFIEGNNINIPISIDTRSSEVAKACVENGADIINDVSGLTYDFKMANTIAELGVPVIIQHSKGTPEDMQIYPEYSNIMDEIYLDLMKKADYAIECGIKPEKIIIDPGIGFGKTKEQNFEILKRADEFSSLNYPVMIGVSRKSLLGMPNESNEVKDIFTLAINSTIIGRNVNFLRVHNVQLHRKLLDMLYQ